MKNPSFGIFERSFELFYIVLDFENQALRANPYLS